MKLTSFVLNFEIYTMIYKTQFKTINHLITLFHYALLLFGC